jgi:hypothetical protein
VDGRLVFVTPAAPLTPGARYTLTVNGAEDHTGLLVPFTAVDFTTARGAAAPPTSSAMAADRSPHRDHAAHAGDADEHSHLPKMRPPLGGPAELDETTWRGERDADGKPRSRWQKLPPLQARPGVTALAGQVLRLNGEPLAQVTLAIGGAETRTDNTGRFLLPGVPTGRQGLLIDGSTANTRGRTYGSFFPGVDITAGTTTVLPWTVWMPLIDMAHAVPLPIPTAGPLVVKSPRIPGLEVHIPDNVILQTGEGPLTVVALTRLSVEQPPFPVPDGATFLWTPQTHGALVVRPDGTPSPVGVRFILPNIDGYPAGRGPGRSRSARPVRSRGRRPRSRGNVAAAGASWRSGSGRGPIPFGRCPPCRSAASSTDGRHSQELGVPARAAYSPWECSGATIPYHAQGRERQAVGTASPVQDAIHFEEDPH